ncbi:MAG: Hpt domain-containing protein [Candidatus Synoicihabitans palmerolidicus]|nr:Hpt domain-containing protein [Candidatus Synoicihabitans palmerolidicus]
MGLGGTPLTDEETDEVEGARAGRESVGDLLASADWDPRPVRLFESLTTREGECLAVTMVKLFRDDTAQRLDDVWQQYEIRDADELEQVAHKLAANIGAVVIRDALREIENLAADHGWAEMPEQFDRARNSWLRLAPVLTVYVCSQSQSLSP